MLITNKQMNQSRGKCTRFKIIKYIFLIGYFEQDYFHKHKDIFIQTSSRTKRILRPRARSEDASSVLQSIEIKLNGGWGEETNSRQFFNRFTVWFVKNRRLKVVQNKAMSTAILSIYLAVRITDVLNKIGMSCINRWIKEPNKACR